MELGIPDHLTCLLRNLYAGWEATVRTRYGTIAWFKLGKGVHQSCTSSSCLFNLYAEYIMQNVGLEDSQAGVKISGRNTATSDIHVIHSNGRKRRGTKEAFDEGEWGEWKSWLKTQHWKNEDQDIWSNHFVANRWGSSGNSGRFYFLGLWNHCGPWLQPQN